MDDCLICMNVKDAVDVLPSAVIIRCSECGDGIWISPSGVNIIATRPVLPICNRCADKMIASDPHPEVVPLNEEQRGELAHHWGIGLKGKKR